MFTGIVTALGRVRAISGDQVVRVELTAPFAADGIALGASIAHAGACLTVVDKGDTDEGCWYAVEISPETLQQTTLGVWAVGDMVNLERSLQIGDELGGHMVTGHVDDVGTVIDYRHEGEWFVFTIRPPEALSKFIARKGSITVDGVSLTVNAVTESTFQIMIIPHTAAITTLGKLRTGDHVNLEVDIMARYAARLSEFEGVPA
jgi:riboflavin synthase